jgi:hypothetical protein
MNRRVLMVMLALVCAVANASAQDVPDARGIVERVIAAAGGEAFSELGILELEISQTEIRNDGTAGEASYKVFVDTRSLRNFRMEFGGDVVVAKNSAGGWSTTAGALDDRPQASKMATLTINQSIFPLLLPFSLAMDGVRFDQVRETEVDGRAVWVISVPFVKGFFKNPVMVTTWILVVAQDDYSILSLEFAPAQAYRDVSPVGVRYRIFETQELEGATIAKQLLAVGVNWQYQESGASRVSDLTAKIVPWDATLFLSPAQIAALEEKDE